MQLNHGKFEIEYTVNYKQYCTKYNILIPSSKLLLHLYCLLFYVFVDFSNPALLISKRCYEMGFVLCMLWKHISCYLKCILII